MPPVLLGAILLLASASLLLALAWLGLLEYLVVSFLLLLLAGLGLAARGLAYRGTSRASYLFFWGGVMAVAGGGLTLYHYYTDPVLLAIVAMLSLAALLALSYYVGR